MTKHTDTGRRTAVSLIEKIAASFTTEWLTDDEKRTLAQAALTAIMGEGDGVQEAVAAEQAEAFGKAYRAEQLANYGCGGVVQCTYPHDGNCVCFNATLARHRSTAAAAERARIVANVRQGLHWETDADLADAIERGEV